MGDKNIVNMIFEYWKSVLNSNNRHLYEQMYNAFKAFKEEVPCPGFAIRDISSVYEAVYNDHPELFYLSYAPRIVQGLGFIGKTEKSIQTDYIFSKKEIKEYQESIDILIKTLETKIVRLDENEKEKAICDYLVEHCVYEINNKYNQNAATVLLKNKGQCSGIAKANKLLLDHFNIESIYVSGEARDERSRTFGPHSWNIVKIKGKYYHLDVTSIIGCNCPPKKPYNYLYFNYSDDEIGESHRWNKAELPKCNYSYSNSTMKIINSLYELRELLRCMDYTHIETITFKNKIPSADINSLMRNVLQTAMSAVKQKGIRAEIQVKVVGDLITLVFNKK